MLGTVWMEMAAKEDAAIVTSYILMLLLETLLLFLLLIIIAYLLSFVLICVYIKILLIGHISMRVGRDSIIFTDSSLMKPLYSSPESIFDID